MTEKTGTQAKRNCHCACAPGDLSAIAPVTAPPAEETTAKPDGSKPSTPATAVAPGVVEGQKKTRG